MTDPLNSRQKRDLDRWVGMFEEAERQLKGDPLYESYWQAKAKEAGDKLDAIASQILDEPSEQ